MGGEVGSQRRQVPMSFATALPGGLALHPARSSEFWPLACAESSIVRTAAGRSAHSRARCAAHRLLSRPRLLHAVDLPRRRLGSTTPTPFGIHTSWPHRPQYGTTLQQMLPQPSARVGMLLLWQDPPLGEAADYVATHFPKTTCPTLFPKLLARPGRKFPGLASMLARRSVYAGQPRLPQSVKRPEQHGLRDLSPEGLGIAG